MATAVAGLALLAWGSSRSGTASSIASVAGHIAYVSAAGNGYNVWVMNADGTDQRELVALVQPAGVSNLRWSDEGQTLTFHGDVGGDDVSHWDYTTDLDGHWSRQPAPDYVAQYSRATKITVDGRLQGYAIANSPGGTKVASYVGLQSSAPWSSLMGDDATGNSETTSAWISNPDGSDAHQLTTEYGYSSPTDWSPDGNWIAMNCAPEFWQGGESVPIPWMPSQPRPMGVCLVHADGSGLTRLADGCNATWSAVGQWLVFARQGSLHVMRSDGSDQQAFADYGGGYSTYAWSQSRGETLGPAMFELLC